MKNKHIALLIGLLSGLGPLHAQVDPHFSQYYANPLWLNPALTGASNAELRLNANYKSQWITVNNAYETAALSADFKLRDKIGLGLTVLNQSAGHESYNHFSGYASASYAVRVSNDGHQRLSFGLQAGIINRSFDISRYEFGSQFVPGSGFDPSVNSMENFSGNSTTVFDANTGIYFQDMNPLKKANLFGGISVAHIVRPRDPYFSTTNDKIPLRYTFHGGTRIKANEQIDVTPNLLFIQQQKASIKAVGLYSEFKFPGENGLMLGGMYRFEDAAIANLGYRMSNLTAGASYDFNTSSLERATNSQGGLEISLSYVFRKKGPETEQVGPRL